MSEYIIEGIEELMIYHTEIDEKIFFKIKDDELKKLIDKNIADNSFRAFNIDEKKFKLKGKKNIKSSLDYKEKNHLGKINKGKIRIITWEILEKTNAKVDEFPETVKEVVLKIDGNNYGCLNSLEDNLLTMLHNLQAFTNFSFHSGEKKLDLAIESESYGNIKEKISFFMNSDAMSASFSNLDSLKDKLTEIKDDLK